MAIVFLYCPSEAFPLDFPCELRFQELCLGSNNLFLMKKWVLLLLQKKNRKESLGTRKDSSSYQCFLFEERETEKLQIRQTNDILLSLTFSLF
jgi:hypothetical protein